VAALAGARLMRDRRPARRLPARLLPARLLLAALLAAAGRPGALAAQQQHVLVITGLGGEPAYRAAFSDVARRLHEVATTRWRVPAEQVTVLVEDPARDPQRFRGRSSRESVAAAFLALAGRVRPGDLVFVFLHGHGSGVGPESQVNLAGPDPTAADFATWLSGFSAQTVVFVNAASASGDFARVLAGPRRVVLTSTRSSVERNETQFAGHFVRGLETLEADADKDGRVSVLEAFDYARRAVEASYESANKLLTEHAVLSDSSLAATVALGARATSTDPRVAALVAERAALEAQVAALRARKAILDEAAYEAELERLLLAIAGKTQAIRAAGGTP
jgi:hypothetical protein